MTTYWLKQTPDKPLFPNMLWSKPENKLHAGKLLVIGGNLHGFSAPATAFAEARKAGIGSQRVVLPDAIQKTVGALLPEADFAPSTPSGSFAQQALGAWLEHSAWADSVLLPGDLGRNSETAIVLEKFLHKYPGQITLTKDALDYCLATPDLVLGREHTLLVASFAQLQKIATSAHFSKAFTYDMDLLRLIENLHELTTKHHAHILTRHHDTVLVAVDGQVSTTPTGREDIWRVKTAAHAAVWWLQHESLAFQALTTSLV